MAPFLGQYNTAQHMRMQRSCPRRTCGAWSFITIANKAPWGHVCDDNAFPVKHPVRRKTSKVFTSGTINKNNKSRNVVALGSALAEGRRRDAEFEELGIVSRECWIRSLKWFNVHTATLSWRNHIRHRILAAAAATARM